MQNQIIIDASELNPEKAELFKRMELSNETMYITGKAGSGKSYLLNFFVKNSHKSVAVVAPTGVAALNVGGQTIHSFFGLDINVQDLTEIKEEGVYGRRRELLRNLDTLVIDEASMVRVDILDAIDLKMQLANNNSKPFGGKQVILFGDLYQLPPVVESQVAQFLRDKYGSIFFFRAPVFERMPLKIYELSTVFRQKELEFVDVLNHVRVGQVTESDLKLLNSRTNSLANSRHRRFIVLAPRNDVVTKINQEALAGIRRLGRTYTAEVEGDFKNNAFPTEAELKLKVGAQVMMLKNDVNEDEELDNIGKRWVNGTLGIISELKKDHIKVMIDGAEYTVRQVTWYKYEYEYDQASKKLISRPVASFTQYPVRLAWALTIHKAQGQTYQSVEINLEGGVFDAGQVYVALSRCVSLDNLSLTLPIRRKDIIINQEVANFMEANLEW